MTSFFILTLLIITQVLGDICLSQSMKIFGEINSYTPAALIHLVGYLFTSPWIGLGVISLITSLLFYLLAVSRLDLSYVLPIQAFSYVLNALLAWLIISESISYFRWFSTFIIAIGVFIVGWTETHTSIINYRKNRKVKTVNLSELALGFGGKARKESNYKRLQRFTLGIVHEGEFFVCVLTGSLLVKLGYAIFSSNLPCPSE